MSSSAINEQLVPDRQRMIEFTVRACRIATEAAAEATKAIADCSEATLASLKQHEEELDTLDREINEGVTAAITESRDAAEIREMLACLKLVLELERIGDLLLSFVTRLRTCSGRLEEQDVKDLANMASLLHNMLHDGGEAFVNRDTRKAVTVLRADSEMDRLRNLVFVRHVENPEGVQRSQSFHVVLMAQALERSGDHAKNIAEEVVQLVTGRSVRHLLRSYDKPWENMFVEWMRRRTVGEQR